MFESVISHMNRGMELDERELAAPVTLDGRGDIVTVGELVDLEVKRARARLSIRDDTAGDPTRPLPDFTTEEMPRPVQELGDEEIRKIAIEALKMMPDDLAFGSMGDTRGLSPQQLQQEIRRRTERGNRFVEAVRDDSMFLQEAIRAGKVVVRGQRQQAAFDF